MPDVFTVFLNKDDDDDVPISPGAGRGGYSTKFIRGGSPPRSNPLPFYFLFLADKLPLSYKKCTPFTYLVSAASFLTAVNARSLGYEYTSNQNLFLDFFTAIVC